MMELCEVAQTIGALRGAMCAMESERNSLYEQVQALRSERLTLKRKLREAHKNLQWATVATKPKRCPQCGQLPSKSPGEQNG